jgi:hypothetical protein
MIDQDITDKLTNAVCDWAAAASHELQGQRDLIEAFNACVNAAELQIVVKLRHGVIELQGIKEDKYIVLYRHKRGADEPANHVRRAGEPQRPLMN